MRRGCWERTAVKVLGMDESGLTQRREGDDDIAGLTTCLRGQEPLKILLTRVFYLFVRLFKEPFG